MTAKSHWRGHPIEYLHGQWVYSDTQEVVSEHHNDRPCGHCNKFSTDEGHDACLGTLQGVMNACCGHGDVDEVYIQFMDGSCVRKKDAVTIIEILKRNNLAEGKEF